MYGIFQRSSDIPQKKRVDDIDISEQKTFGKIQVNKIPRGAPGAIPLPKYILHKATWYWEDCTIKNEILKIDTRLLVEPPQRLKDPRQISKWFNFSLGKIFGKENFNKNIKPKYHKLTGVLEQKWHGEFDYDDKKMKLKLEPFIVNDIIYTPCKFGINIRGLYGSSIGNIELKFKNTNDPKSRIEIHHNIHVIVCNNRTELSDYYYDGGKYGKHRLLSKMDRQIIPSMDTQFKQIFALTKEENIKVEIQAFLGFDAITNNLPVGYEIHSSSKPFYYLLQLNKRLIALKEESRNDTNDSLDKRRNSMKTKRGYGGYESA